MNEGRKLNIAYFSTKVRWAYQVRQKMNDQQKKRFSNSELPDIERTISRKLSLIRILVDNTNLEMGEINRILHEHNEDILYCINSHKALVFENIYLIYRVLAYFEAILIQMKATVDLLIKYISIFYCQILLNKKGQTDILEAIKEDGIDIDWRKELYFLRRIVTHMQTGWPSFENMGTYYQLVIDFPKSVRRMKEYEEFPYDRLGTDKMNEIFNNFISFNDSVTAWFVSKI